MRIGLCIKSSVGFAQVFKIATMGLGLQKAYGVNPVEAATEQLVNPELHGFRIWIEWNDHLTSTATGIPLSG